MGSKSETNTNNLMLNFLVFSNYFGIVLLLQVKQGMLSLTVV